jgi:AraC-like DNA-binding protein
MLSPDQPRNGRSVTHSGSLAGAPSRLSSQRHPEYSRLLKVTEGLTFERHRIEYDRTGRYNPLTDTEFPFCIRLFTYRHNDFTAAMTWHEHLELWIPIDSEVSFRMGDRWLKVGSGEILIVDNLKLHTVVDRPGLNARVISIGFLPEFVYSLGSPSYDYYALLPFFNHQERAAHLVRRDAPLYPTMVSTMADLLECYFARELYFQVGCKANLLRLLYALAKHFWVSESLQSVMVRQQATAERLKPVFDYISAHSAEIIAVGKGASLAHLSESRFSRVFKQISGMTFVNYVTHVRLSRALRMLRESPVTIGEVALATGFSDQSYFDRRFKAAFGRTPNQVRISIKSQEPARSNQLPTDKLE